MEEQVRRGVRRTITAARIADLVGLDRFTITDLQNGWPSLGTLVVDGQPLQVSLFAGRVGPTGRGRDARERRFQNPAEVQHREIVLDPQRYPLLLGLLEGDGALHIERPLLMLPDPIHRAGKVTRTSVFVSVASLLEAAEKGWSEALNRKGETIRCFYPQLLPVVVAGLLEDAIPASYALQSAIEGSGLSEASGDDIAAAAERARRAATTLVRDARFSRRVITAYGGLCAMCGLDAELVQAAHIYPASAPGSQDEPWNGLALCPNHHLAF
jgi:HNH endonuclease